MKDIYRNPMLYFALAPFVVALWALLVGGWYLPIAEKAYETKEGECTKAELLMTEILKLDPDRRTDSNETPQEFSYSNEVYRVAGLCKIPASKCTLTSKQINESRGQKTQGATVLLQDVNVQSFAQFLDTLQFRWPGLETERIKLTATKGPPDTWRIDINFKYYY
jgi:hypothetical protein